MRACANSSASLTERSRRNDCQGLGKFVISRVTAPSPTPPLSTVPSQPIAFTKDAVLTLTDPHSAYWVYVPDPYDSTHQTPTELFVWMHGCGGEGAGDIYTISPSTSERYISLSVGGREDACWDPNVDQDKVLAAIADVDTHFNIDRHRIVIGGYSSGGDLAYRIAFYHGR